MNEVCAREHFDHSPFPWLQVVKIIKEVYNQMNKNQAPFIAMDITVGLPITRCVAGAHIFTYYFSSRCCPHKSMSTLHPTSALYVNGQNLTAAWFSSEGRFLCSSFDQIFLQQETKLLDAIRRHFERLFAQFGGHYDANVGKLGQGKAGVAKEVKARDSQPTFFLFA